jgi:hypothetical protein
MKLGIMQPYFFPYLGYFDLINCTDTWLVYDTVQYIQQGWINRNRVLHPRSGWQYITVPLKKASFHRSFQTPIKDVQISNQVGWNERIIRQLYHYKKESPYFSETIKFVADCLSYGDKSISHLNVSILSKVCDLIEIDFNYHFFSEMNLQLDPALGPEEKVITICRTLNASEYVNLPGGSKLYNERNFRGKNMKLTFRELPTFKYSCRGYEFIPNLSIIDLLMWNKPETIKQYLDEHRDGE